MNKLSFVDISPSFSHNPISKGCSILIRLAGCDLCCSGCNTKHLQDYSYGKEMCTEDLLKQVLDFKNKFLKHSSVTLAGGEPFYYKNRDAVLELCGKLRESFDGDVCIYTGYSSKFVKTMIGGLPEGVIVKCGAYSSGYLAESSGKMLDKSEVVMQLASTNQDFYRVKKGQLIKVSDQGKIKIR